jgi:hypothetical protein
MSRSLSPWGERLVALTLTLRLNNDRANLSASLDGLVRRRRFVEREAGRH